MTALLYDLLYGIPLCLIALLVGGPMLGQAQDPKMLVVGLFTFGICASLKYWASRLRFLLPGVAVAVGAGIVLVQPAAERGEFLARNLWILWIVLLSAVCFQLGRAVAKTPFLRRIMAVILFGDLLIALFRHIFPAKAVTALELFFLLLCAAEEVQLRWEKSGTTDRRGHLVSIAPFLVAVGLITYFVPAPERPFDWSFAVRIWERATEGIKLTSRFFHQGEEDYALVGFAESGNFWGNLQKKDKNVLELTGRSEAGPVIYLRGKVMDTFDGRNWTAVYEETGRDTMLDTLESLSGVILQEPDFVRNYLLRADIKCRYDEYNTKHFFVPLKMALGKEKIGEYSYVQRGGNLAATETLGYGAEYSVTFYRLNQGHEEVRESLRNLKEVTAEVWEKVREQYDPAGRSSDNTYEAFQEYRERIRKYYLPETEISETIASYLEKLFDGAESDFDKLDRLERMLSAYNYSVSPGKLPEEIDDPAEFLDYFMLELREGYCSHFATAFVLLARSQGIPARYVQGFYVPKGDAGTITVTTSMAHAWPEAYLEGYGWVAFEPTPGKKQVTRWAFRTKEVPEATWQTKETQEEEEDDEVILPEEVTAEEPESIRWYVILLPMGLGILFLGVFLLIDRMLSKRWFKSLGITERFAELFRRNQKLLGWLGLRREKGETLEEFRLRILEEIPSPFLEFLEDYEEVIYGGAAPDEEMNVRAEKAYEYLLDLLKEKEGKRFWLKYLLFDRKPT